MLQKIGWLAGIFCFTGFILLVGLNATPAKSAPFSSCCDSDCLKGLCQGSINRIYEFCGFGLLIDGKVLSPEEGVEFCISVDETGCLIEKVAESRGCGIGCYEGELFSGCEDEIIYYDRICESIEKKLERFCDVDLVGGKAWGGKDDYEENGCGC